MSQKPAILKKYCVVFSFHYIKVITERMKKGLSMLG